MVGIKCSKCSKSFKPKHLHLHHVFPKYLGGTDANTKRIYLCKLHHDSIHNFINILGLKEEKEIIDFTNKWLEHKDDFHYCPICKKEDRLLCVGEIHGDCIILRCSYCGYQERNENILGDVLQKNIDETLNSIKKEEKKNGGSVSKV